MTAPAINRVLAHTGARYPIIQAPMGWIARTQLASAVSRAGGLGIIETSSGETANCQAEITKMSALGLPFGVNLPIRFLKDDAMLRFVCASGVKFVTTSAGSPAKFIAPLKDAGITVYHAVPTVDAALKCVDAGIDGLVVEGGEGGGFKNPEEVSTLVLLQAIRAQVDVPLVAAGGICDGRGMAAAFALGAEAVQMGTRFVSCAESPVHANYKNAIVDAGVTGTWMLNTKASPCIRALKSQRTQAIHEAGLMPADSFAGIQRVYFDGDMEAAPALAGQTVGLIDSVKTAQQIIDDTVAEFFAISQRMGAMAAARACGQKGAPDPTGAAAATHGCDVLPDHRTTESLSAPVRAVTCTYTRANSLRVSPKAPRPCFCRPMTKPCSERYWSSMTPAKT